jgi:hypothetical protein
MSRATDINSTTTEETEEPANDSEKRELTEESATDSEAAESLPLDVVFDMLKNERRRKVLKYIREEDGPFTLSELAEHIAALENDKDIAALNSTERKRVYVGLYQCHLPRMADAGVIEFDRHRGTVRPGDNSEQLYPYIDVESDTDGNLRVYAGLMAIFATGLLVGVVAPGQSLPIIIPSFLVLFGGYALATRVDLFES